MGHKVPLMAVAGTSSSNAVRYFPLMNCRADVLFADQGSAQVPFFEDGTLTNLFANPWTNAATGATDVTIEINGVDSALTLTIPSGGTGRYFDNTNTAAIVNGDVACTRVDKGGSGNLQMGVVGCQYETDSGIIVYKVGCSDSASFATGTAYLPMLGDMTAISDNSATQTPRITVAGTVKNLHAYSSSNGRTSVTNFRIRLNGANAGPVIGFPSATNGLQTDTANSASLSVSDNFSYQRVTSAGSGTFVLRHIGCEIHYPANEMNLFAMSATGIAYNAATPRYGTMTGSFSGNGNSAASTFRLYGSGTLSDFYLNVSANAATANARFIVQINETDTSIETTYASATTGTQSDTTNTEVFSNADYLNMAYRKPSGTGATTLRFMSIKVTFDLPPVTFIPQLVWH